MPSFIIGFIKVVCVLVALILVCFALGIGAVVYFNAPPQTGPRPGEALRLEGEDSVLFEVRSGESARSVGKRLEEGALIRSRYFWNVLVRIKDEYIKTGTYRLPVPASQLAIYQVLVSGRQVLQRVTVPEGGTLKKTARLMEEAGICSAGDFLAAAAGPEIAEKYRIPAGNLEGYLYPETYLFPPDYPASLVVKTMVDTFFFRLKSITGDGPVDAGELQQKVILASIVEREYRVNEEAALMAGVFYNRLEIGMALQSCATVEYVITEIQGKPHPEVLYNRDIEIRNPYNTYVEPGLPPGPISSPGAVALQAAFFPEKSDYLYFRLIDPAAGKHYFSRTLDDHIRAGALYTKGR